MRSSIDAVGASTEINAVDIGGEDFILRVGVLKPESQQHFLGGPEHHLERLAERIAG